MTRPFPLNVNLSRLSTYGVLIAFVLELTAFAIISPSFLTMDNLLNVTLQSSINAIIAVGMTFVILTGGIDLSVGSVAALTGIIVTSVVKLPVAPSVAILLAVVAGIAFGTGSGYLTGVFVARFNITPFIVTLAFMTVWRGVAFVTTDGSPVWGLPAEFAGLGGGRALGVPLPTIIMIAVYGIAWVALTRMRFGRHVYAVGGNTEAARLAGIRTKRVFISVYAISGALAALSGVLLASRMNSGQPNAGMMYELDAIAAVVVGGTSLQGGRGTIVGTLIGALLIAVLRNGLNLMNVSSYIQQVIVGAVILVATLQVGRK